MAYSQPSSDQNPSLPTFPGYKVRDVNGTYEFCDESESTGDKRHPRKAGSGHERTSRMSLLEYITSGKSPQWHQEKFGDVLLNHLVIRSSSATSKPIRGADWVEPYNTRCTIMAAKHRDRNNFPNDWIAVKIIRLHGTEKKTNEAKQRFMEEIRNMQTLAAMRHHHIISFIGSYESGGEMGIAMFPVAKYSLKLLLRNVSEDNWVKRDRKNDFSEHHHVWALLRYFLCLSSAVTWLHLNNVKHKDIKPANILIDCKQSIILADFGLSRIYETKEEAGISGGQTEYTLTYAPPEAIDETERSFSTDLFSLACVFLEMITVICGKTTRDLSEKLKFRTSPHNERSKCYASSSEGIREWTEVLKMKQEKVPLAAKSLLTKGLERVNIMMSKEPSARGEATEAHECFKGVVQSAYAVLQDSTLTCERCANVEKLLPSDNGCGQLPTVLENSVEPGQQATHVAHGTTHSSSAFVLSELIDTPLNTPTLEAARNRVPFLEGPPTRPLLPEAEVDDAERSERAGDVTNIETRRSASEAPNASKPSSTVGQLEVPRPSDVACNPSNTSERTAISDSSPNLSAKPSSILMKDNLSNGAPQRKVKIDSQQEPLRCVIRKEGKFYRSTRLLNDLPGQKVIVWNVKKNTTKIEDKDYPLDYKRGILFVWDWSKREAVHIKHLDDKSLNLLKLLNIKLFRCLRGRAQLLFIVSEMSEEGYRQYPLESGTTQAP